MADYNSTQVAQTKSTPRDWLFAHEDRGRVRIKAFDWTTTTAQSDTTNQVSLGCYRSREPSDP